MITIPPTALVRQKQGFVFPGKFDYLPGTHTQLITSLGMNGTVSPDMSVSAGSHIWRVGNQTTNVLDTGDISPSGPWSLGNVNKQTLDADFYKGLETCQEFDAINTAQAQISSNDLPTPSDGTKSLIVGWVGRVDFVDPGAASARTSLMHKHWVSGAPFQGWGLYVNKTTGQVVFEFVDDNQNFLGATDPIVGTGSAAVIVNMDFASGLMKIMTSIAGSYVEFLRPISTGSFVQAAQLRMGLIPSRSNAWLGFFAHGFTLEYSSAIDAEVSEANMIHFLKHASGELTF